MFVCSGVLEDFIGYEEVLNISFKVSKILVAQLYSVSIKIMLRKFATRRKLTQVNNFYDGT